MHFFQLCWCCLNILSKRSNHWIWNTFSILKIVNQFSQWWKYISLYAVLKLLSISIKALKERFSATEHPLKQTNKKRSKYQKLKVFSPELQWFSSACSLWDECPENSPGQGLYPLRACQKWGTFYSHEPPSSSGDSNGCQAHQCTAQPSEPARLPWDSIFTFKNPYTSQVLSAFHMTAALKINILLRLLRVDLGGHIRFGSTSEASESLGKMLLA